MSRILNRHYPLILLLPVVALLLAIALPGRPGVDFRQHAAGPERKARFVAYFLPLVQEANAAILAQRTQLLQLQQGTGLDWWQRRWVLVLADQYGLAEFDPASPEQWRVLQRRVDMVPASLALAQAAKESGWGTSRFAVEGFNFFGQWCFEPGCGLVPARRGEAAVHEVAAFASPRQSLERYLRNLNTHDAYRELRLVRERLRVSGQSLSGPALADGLNRYSERGVVYVDELKAMIRHNELGRFDAS
jgi:Bax protein